jgi:O-antigen/teichoic acid export membrane protein
MIERLAPQAVTFGVSVVIARMVDPAAYGLIGMLGIFMALGAAFSELALSAALVQKKTITQDDETSVFVINIAAGVVLTLVLCAISPLVARFFRQQTLVPLLCAQSLTVLISSFGIVQLALITRTMSFKSNALIEVISCVLSGGVGVSMAWMGKGVWSLIGLNLSRVTFSVVLLWVIRDWRPHGRFRMANVRSMWGYSSNLLYASLIHRVVTNLYSVVIGRFYAPAALGIYTRANSFQALPVGILTGIVQRVAFPLFSKHQDDPPFLLTMLRRQIRVLSFGATAILVAVAAVSDQLIPLLLGHKWDEVIPLLKILCLGGVFASVFPLHAIILQALGKSGLFFRIDLLKKAMIVIVILAVYRFGITALAWGAAFISLTDYVISAAPNVRTIGYRWSMQAWDILPAITLCFISGTCVMQIHWGAERAALCVVGVKALVLPVMVGVGLFTFRNLFFSDVWGLATALLRRRRGGVAEPLCGTIVG